MNKLQQGPCPTCGQLVILPPAPVLCDHDKRLSGSGEPLGFVHACKNEAAWTIVRKHAGSGSHGSLGNFCLEHLTTHLTAETQEGCELTVYQLTSRRRS